jgi:hypothetical protein
MKERIEKIFRILYIILALVPIVLIVYTNAFYFYASIVHGVQLSYGVSGNNESIYAGAKIVSFLFEISIYSGFIFFPAVSFWNIVLSFYKNVKFNLSIVLITLSSFILSIMALYMTPANNVIEWLFD